MSHKAVNGLINKENTGYAAFLCVVLTVRSSFIEDNLKFNLDNRLFALGSGLLRNSTWDKTWSLIKRTGSCFLSRLSLSNLKGYVHEIKQVYLTDAQLSLNFKRC